MATKRISKKIIQMVNEYALRLKKEERLPIERVIIFGSHAKGTAQHWSDIDVCIVSPKFTNLLHSIEFLLVKRNKEEVLAGIEPVGFTRNDFNNGGSFIQEIKKTGIIVH